METRGNSARCGVGGAAAAVRGAARWALISAGDARCNASVILAAEDRRAAPRGTARPRRQPVEQRADSSDEHSREKSGSFLRVDVHGRLVRK